jgi:hypothetical protein
MKFTILAAAVVAAAVVAQPAAAQRPQIVPRAPLLTAFGACAAAQLPGQARELMATPIGSRAERRAARRMAESRSACVDRRMRGISMQTGEFRGAVAEALLERDPQAMDRLRAMPTSAPVRPATVDGRAFVAAYAACLADADPARAAALLDLEPLGPELRPAYLRFGQLLSDCMPFGLRYTIDPVDVRNHMAMRLYHKAYPAPVTATSN